MRRGHSYITHGIPHSRIASRRHRRRSAISPHGIGWGATFHFAFMPISNGMRANLVVVVAVIAVSGTSRTPPLLGVYHRLLAYDECYFNYQLITRHA